MSKAKSQNYEQLALDLLQPKQYVKWGNAMNGPNLASLNNTQINLFTGVCAQLLEMDHHLVRIPYKIVRELIQYKPTSRARYLDEIGKAANVLLDFKVDYYVDNVLVMGNLFSTFFLDADSGDITVRVNPDTSWVLNNLTTSFTALMQKSVLAITSKYTKLLYFQLMQWRTVGERNFTIEEVSTLLGAPKSYSTKKLTAVILKPAIQQLTDADLIEDLKLTPQRDSRTNKYVGYRITFKPMPRLTNLTSEETSQVLRANEVGLYKANQDDHTEDEAIRKIRANPQLNEKMRDKAIAKWRAEHPRPKIPLFKIGEENS